MIFKKPEQIQFVSTIKGLDSIEECLPKPAKYFVPKWFKDIPNSIPTTVKICPSFPDYFSQGYILPMWCDSKIQFDGTNWRWETSMDKFSWDHHGNQQFLNHTKASFNGVKGQFIFKAMCPWKMITPPGWSILQLPLFYHFNQEWSVLPGIIDTDIYHNLNQQILYHGNGKEVTIKKGEPFVLYIPFKRSNKLELNIKYQTEDDIKKFEIENLLINNSFHPNGSYRTMQRKRNTNN